MAKAGRPKRVFSDEDVAHITEMALNNCNTETIANVLEIPVNTLKRHYGRLLKQKRAEHRTKLRTAQAKAITEGVPSMLIFLGKNELNQSDKQEIKHTGQVLAVSEAEREPLREAAKVYKEKAALKLAGGG